MVEVRYVETAADHQMTAFLASLTPGKVLKDRERNFTPVERKRQRFLREKSAVEREVIRSREVRLALELAELMKGGNA